MWCIVMVAVIHTKVFFYKNVGNCNKAYKGKQLEYCLKYFQLHSCKQNLSVAIVQTKVPSYKLCTQKLSQLWHNFAIFFLLITMCRPTLSCVVVEVGVRLWPKSKTNLILACRPISFLLDCLNLCNLSKG